MCRACAASDPPRRALAQAQLDEGRPGELRRRPEAAPLGVEAGGDARPPRCSTRASVSRPALAARRPAEGAGRRRRRPRAVARASSLSASARRSSRCTAPTSASACSSTWARSLTQASPRACDDAAEGRHAVALDRGEVGPGVEGAPVGRAEDGHGPAPGPGQRLRGRHVDGVEIGTLLAVDLDRDERLGQVGRRVRVLEALVRHDVAPVARGVPDGDEEGLVLLAGPAQGLVPPGEPLHGIVGVLAEIRAGLVGQVVHGSDARAPSPDCGTPAAPCKAQAMELELKGKTALITGGSRGIGLAMAARFVEAGANVMITLPQGGRPGRGGGRPRGRGRRRGAGGLDRRPRRQARGRPVLRGRDAWPASAASTSWSTTPGPTRTSAR